MGGSAGEGEEFPLWPLYHRKLRHLTHGHTLPVQVKGLQGTGGGAPLLLVILLLRWLLLLLLLLKLLRLRLLWL